MANTVYTRPVEYPYISCNGRYLPYIPVTIHGRMAGAFYGMVDSGASMSLAHSSIAEDLGISLDDAEKTVLAGATGFLEHIPVYVKNNVLVTLGKLGGARIPIAFTIYDFPEAVILGREGFFESFEITFREWERKVLLRKRN